MLVLLTCMMMAVNYQEETIDERVSFRLGEEIARLRSCRSLTQAAWSNPTSAT